MHRAFENADIVSTILRLTDDARTALSVALSARCFLEEGLKAAWAYADACDLARTAPKYIHAKEESGETGTKAFVRTE